MALADVTRELTSAGLFDRAENVALSIVDDDMKVQALSGLIQALATADQHEHATRIAFEAQNTTRITARSLPDLTRAFISVGDMRSARRLVALPLAASNLTVSLPLLALLEPGTLAAVSNLLQRRYSKPI